MKSCQKRKLKKKLSSDLSFHTYSWNAFHGQMHISKLLLTLHQVLSSFFFNQEPNVTELQSSILLNCEQQKYIKHVNDSGWSLSGWKRWRWFPLHDLCITRNVWRMLMIIRASCVVIGQCSSCHMTRFRKLPWRLP